MKSLTIHNIDEPLLALLRDKARREGKSINQTVMEIFEQETGMKAEKQPPHLAEFEGLCGVWTAQDLAEFKKATKDFEKIDVEE
jgi:plasmid stability protein